MKKFIAFQSAITVILVNLLLPDAAFGDPRAQTVQIICGNQLYHNNSISVPNFVDTMEKLSPQMQTSGYGMAVTSSGPDTNYALAECYGDLSLLECVLCYAEARTILPQCFPYNGGRVFLDGCFMRAENYSFFQEYTGPNDRVLCGNRTQKSSAFRVSARQAVEKVVSAPSHFYARAQVPVSGTANESAYVLADCWRTLSVDYCKACLENASASILGCLPRSEGRALNAGCFMRYSDTNFLNPTQVNGSLNRTQGNGIFNTTQGNGNLNTAQGNGSSRGKKTIITVATVSSIAVLVIGAVIGVYIRKHRTIQKKKKGDAEKLVNTLYGNCLNFKYSTLEKATGSFDEANKLGQGGFGTVYKGVLLGGREIAVKRLFFNNKHRAADFYNEVNIISSVEHKNLVRLLGCSFSGPESLLVYEYLPNKSLDFFIFDSSKGKTLNWEKRIEIIIGTAEGLVYLHENTKTRIVHRDIKASNILLDSRFHAKIADFGLARSFQEDKSHISTAIAGTLGYMAPEYLARGQLTEKADVYSFGVLLIEIVSGRQNNRSKASEYSDSSLTLVWNHFQRRTVEEMFDPNLTLHNYYNADVKTEILRVVHVGLLCTQENPSLRPSMSKALEMLVYKEEHLPAPNNPPYIYETIELNDTHQDQHSPVENGNPASITTISQSTFYPR
ncbi:cysteine-rich receptor kinase 2 [Olea europaea subsp. europaea]|uniref:Cysteine-rich receptor kinase 2 n=1 Tax=Olea europaea subsp. europaea TaxID=158383 RepID=A0A8S0U9S2_OLEEU|nr:cysteine-rich receptor kinase 2 [Olea europaea subsp. europaea]